MVDLCEFLEVSKSNTNDIVIEQCEKYNSALQDFVLVLEQNQIPVLEAWIRKNVKNTSEHCIKMLENNPASTFSFLMRMRGLDNCTSEIVCNAGGIQQFIDKYSSRGVSKPAEEPMVEESMVEKPIVEEPAATEPVVQESITEEPVVKEPVAEPAVPQLQEKEQIASPLQAQVKKTEPEIERHVTIQEELIHRHVRNVMEYDPDLIDEITDGQIAASVAKLKALNDNITLRGLPPEMVLSDSDLKCIYDKLSAYPESVFKDFILAYLKSVTSESERFRISAVMADFLDFVVGGAL